MSSLLSDTRRYLAQLVPHDKTRLAPRLLAGLLAEVEQLQAGRAEVAKKEEGNNAL